MKILQIPRRFVRSDWGGTETVILQTSRQLLAQGHETAVWCPNALATSNEEVIDSVPVRRFDYFYPYFGLKPEAVRRLDQKGGNLFSFAMMRALRNEPGVDLLHLHTSKRLGGIVRHVAMKRRIPYVVSVHGGLFDVPSDEAATWTEPTQGTLEWGKALGAWVGSRRVFDDAAAIICVGREEQAKTQQQYPEKNVLHLPNGVDPERFARGDGGAFRSKYGIPMECPLILVTGRIDPQKNQLTAVESFRLLRDSVPNCHLLLLGHVTNDAYRGKLEAAITESGLSRNVTLIPGVDSGTDDLVNAFHAANVFLLPSVHEPFGIVILEAWAAGLPVAASRVGGIPSFVEDGRDGLLFDPAAPAQIAEALQTLLTNKEKANSIAEAGRTKAREEYSWCRVTEQLVTIYEEALRAHPLPQ
ncbi:MAG: hypothetical protein PWP23_2677 [Candidatus Sumerlaeota bacterium]|nr:hypothetical protein [Candidatus Sumerlaeota bacterium]